MAGKKPTGGKIKTPPAVSNAACSRYHEVLSRWQDSLKAGGGGIHCNTLKGDLESLDFIVRKANSGNHHAYSHPGLPGFFGGSFDGGHGKNDVVKPCYIRNALRVLRQYGDYFKQETNGGDEAL